jgi:hypothetical protein
MSYILPIANPYKNFALSKLEERFSYDQINQAGILGVKRILL